MMKIQVEPELVCAIAEWNRTVGRECGIQIDGTQEQPPGILSIMVKVAKHYGQTATAERLQLAAEIIL